MSLTKLPGLSEEGFFNRYGTYFFYETVLSKFSSDLIE